VGLARRLLNAFKRQVTQHCAADRVGERLATGPPGDGVDGGDDGDDADGDLVATLRVVEEARALGAAHLGAFASAVARECRLPWFAAMADACPRSILFAVLTQLVIPGRDGHAASGASATLSARVARFYAKKFREYLGRADADAEADFSVEDVMGSSWARDVAFVGQMLHAVGLDDLSEQAYAEVVLAHVASWIASEAAGCFSRECLPRMREYNRRVALGFLALLVDPARGDDMAQWRRRLDFFAYETLGALRTEEMFDIVVDYPDSAPALRDLRTCLEHTDAADSFVRSFRSQLRKRLLHLGADTPVILSQYVASVRALNALDPSGILAELVCPLVKEYVRARPDATRCIVQMVIYENDMLACKDGDGGGDNSDDADVDAGRDAATATADGDDRDDLEIVAAALKWEPVPVLAAQLFDTDKSCSRDMASTLIDVAGKQENFIKEYKMVLAERLLAMVQDDEDIDYETRILELLKIRFGADVLRDCEIMLKDMADSKRITTRVRTMLAQMNQQEDRDVTMAGGDSDSDAPRPSADSSASLASTPPLISMEDFSVVTLSEIFWPPLVEGAVHVLPSIDGMLERFGAQYKAMKAPRTLHWKPHLGVVELELEFFAVSDGDGADGVPQQVIWTKTFTVSVAQACIIMQFEKQKQWDGAELAEATGIDDGEGIGEKASVWVNSGVLRKTREADGRVTYTLVEDVDQQVEHPYAWIEPDLSVMSVEQQMEMNMKVYECYIMGMVTNLESLPLEKIHNMLKMFVLEPVYDKTVDELQTFLAKLVSDGKLFFDGLVYRKNKGK